VNLLRKATSVTYYLLVNFLPATADFLELTSTVNEMLLWRVACCHWPCVWQNNTVDQGGCRGPTRKSTGL